MKPFIRKVVVLAFCLAAGLSVHCHAAGNTYSSPLAKDKAGMVEVRRILDSLDMSLANRNVSRELKQTRMKALENKFSEAGLAPSDRYRYGCLLYDEYCTYKSTLMYRCASSLYSLSKEMADKDQIVLSELRLVYTYLWTGAFKEAQELMNSIDTTGCALSTRAEYLRRDFELQFESAFYVASSGFFREAHINRLENIAREAETILPEDNWVRVYVKEKMASFIANYSESWNMARKRLEKPNLSIQEMLEAHSSMGFCMLEMGDTVAALRSMCKSAEIAIDLGSYQEPTLRKIAESIYPLGELRRSYDYISLAMENAKFFGSTYRIYESALSQPLIDKILYEDAKTANRRLTVFILISLFLLLVVMFFCYFSFMQAKSIRKSAKRVQDSAEAMSELNRNLDESNRQLEEANLIKSTYIEHILSEDSSIVIMMENLVDDIEMKVRVRQYDDIVPYIYRNGYRKKRKELMSNFDDTFLMLFPHFVEDINELLVEDARFATGSKTLPVELRILALMRLGVCKSVTIGKILNLSDSTVRNYKTKMRNRSKVQNEEFDAAVMRISPSAK